MSAWELPISLEIGGVDYKIRSDFRVILDILKVFNDPDYEPDEKWEICLDILYEDYEKMPYECREEAAKKAVEFIDMGVEQDGKTKSYTMDWEQDAGLIIPAVNKVIGCEVRSAGYMHWWTFLGAYLEIGDGLFSQVVSIRQKKMKHKKLEKWEREFYNENKEIIDLKKKYTDDEIEKQEYLKKLFD